MVGFNDGTLLVDGIISGPEGNFETALDAADRMSIRSVREVLEEEVAPVDSNLCHRFIEKWLSHLVPALRLAASIEVAHLYFLDLVDIPHAEDLVLERLLRFGADSFSTLETELLANRDLARNPDSSFGLKFIKELERDVDAHFRPAKAVLATYYTRLKRLSE